MLSGSQIAADRSKSQHFILLYPGRQSVGATEYYSKVRWRILGSAKSTKGTWKVTCASSCALRYY